MIFIFILDKIVPVPENAPGYSSKYFRKVQYVVFGLLSIASALTAMIVWYSNWLENNRIGISPMTSNSDTLFNGPCQHWEIVGDGYCDDVANI